MIKKKGKGKKKEVQAKRASNFPLSFSTLAIELHNII
jgi:hypothetical protein